MTRSGILNVNKSAGETSFQTVKTVRGATGVRKAGHAGSLDPAATWVSLVCLGRAVRVTEYLMDLRKVYRATVRLGVATDTYDAEGTVTERVLPVDVSEHRLRNVLQHFMGEIEQAPPPYSAVKVG